MNWIHNINDRFANVFRLLRNMLSWFVDLLDWLSINIMRFAMIGILLNIISSNFYPEFPSRFPIIYGWFDGWLQFLEFGAKAAVGTVYSFFTGNLSEFWPEYTASFDSLKYQFVTWLSLIHF